MREDRSAEDLYVNGKSVATSRIEQTQCCVFSADEGTDVGVDLGTPVSDTYQVPFNFTGKIASVTIELKEEAKPVAAKEKERSPQEAGLRESVLKRALSNQEVN